MKPVLLLLLLLITFNLQGQFTFEEVTTPDDRSIRLLRKSPTSEYFLQLLNDYNGIYKSLNGHDWTRDTILNLANIDITQWVSVATKKKVMASFTLIRTCMPAFTRMIQKISSRANMLCRSTGLFY